MRCISCGEKKLKLFLKMKNVPPSTQVVPRNVLLTDKKITLSIFQCQQCTLLQIPKSFELKKEYYEEYLIDRSYSDFANKYQKKVAGDFIAQFELKNKSILEVGCGDGFFAELLQKEGAKVTGIDPSEAACKETSKKGIKVICGYVDENLKLDKKFHAFTMCQVLEHIINPRKFLKAIREQLLPDGYGFIEVPSLAKTLREKRFHDFFPDHVAYYNAASLSYLLTLSGFEVLDMHQSVNNEFLTAVVRTSNTSQANKNMQEDFLSIQKRVKLFMKSLKGKKVIAWGAGIRGISLLSYSGASNRDIKFCIDSDPDKHGLFLPGVNMEVVKPEIIKRQKFDVVIITASLYTDEIVKSLRKKLNYKNKIAVLFPEPKYL